MTILKKTIHWVFTILMAFIISVVGLLITYLDEANIVHIWICFGGILLLCLYRYHRLVIHSLLPYILLSIVAHSRFDIFTPSVFSAFWGIVVLTGITIYLYCIIPPHTFLAHTKPDWNKIPNSWIKLLYAYIGLLLLLGNYLYKFSDDTIIFLMLGNIIMLQMLWKNVSSV